MVADRGTLLTRLELGRLEGEALEQLSDDDKQRLWEEVFSTEWPGDLDRLPDCWLPAESFWHIRSRAMYLRVKALGLDAFREGLQHAAARNRLMDQIVWKRPRDVAETAAESGSLWLLRDVIETRRAVAADAKLAERAAQAGHLNVLEWIVARLPASELAAELMDGAAAGGHLHIVQWLHSHQNARCTTAAMDFAAAFGHLAVVEWLHEHRSEGCSPRALVWAAQNGAADVVAFLLRNYSNGATGDAVEEAAANGHLAVVQMLAAADPAAVTAGTVCAAARGGHCRLLQWLSDGGFSNHFTSKAAEEAVEGGMAALEWFWRHRGERFTSEALVLACDNSEILEWLLDRISPDVNLQPAYAAAIARDASECMQLLQSKATDIGILLDDDAEPPAGIAAWSVL
nr:hypothetical protein HK105_007947 [Polyrhizophydium stewartii]